MHARGSGGGQGGGRLGPRRIDHADDAQKYEIALHVGAPQLRETTARPDPVATRRTAESAHRATPLPSRTFASFAFFA